MDASVREHKTKLYDDTMRGLMRMLNLGSGKPLDEKEMKTFFADVTPPLITYGSRGVILAWNKFRKVSRTVGIDPIDMMLSFEGLLKAMRQDLGHRVISHQPGELLSIFINDMDEAITKRKSTK